VLEKKNITQIQTSKGPYRISRLVQDDEFTDRTSTFKSSYYTRRSRPDRRSH
jgi:hypothetical protein